MSSKKELIYRTIEHLISQGRPSKKQGDDLLCLYRGPNGTKCAIGFWIPDEKYDPEMETMTVDEMLARFFGSLDPQAIEHIDTLEQLQHLHDDPLTWRGPDSLYEACVNFCRGAELEANPMWQHIARKNWGTDEPEA